MDFFRQVFLWAEEFFLKENGDLNIIAKIIISIIIIIVVNLISVFVTKIVNKLIERDVHIINYQKHKTLTTIIGKIIKYIFYFIAIVQILDLFGVPTASIIATAGIGGVVVALGAKSIVEDIFSGVFILLEDQFRLGDTVIIGGFEGIVIDFGLRTTTLRGYDGSRYFITNGQINSLVNKSRENQRARIDIQIPYHTELKKVEEIVDEVSKRLTKELKYITKAPQFVGVTAVSHHSKTITVWGWAKPGKQIALELEIRRAIITAMEEEGIQFPKQVLEEEG